MNESQYFFNKENFYDAVRIWECASISLVDIRYKLISPEEPIKDYWVPTSTFVYTGGKGDIVLDKNSYSVDRFGIFHAQKGARLSIYSKDKWMECYILLYRGSEWGFHKKEMVMRMKKTNPFQLQYGFIPSNPIFFAEQMKKMYENFKQPNALERFYVKTVFYQVVYEVYKELSEKNIKVLHLDVITMAKNYLDEHYQEDISIQSIASYIGISDSHFRRSFKSKYEESPQEYLMKKRLILAKELLADETLSIRYIADFCGFSDEFHFSKLFLKRQGMSPKEYRAKIPRGMSDYTMEAFSSINYNELQRVSCDELKEEGVIYMLKKMKNKTITVAAVSMVLLLTACSVNKQANTNQVESNKASSAKTQSADASETDVKSSETKTIDTIMGQVEVPTSPQRIAAFGTPGDLIAMGVKPIAGDTQTRLFDGVVDDENYTYIQMDQYEDIIKLEPDLILVANISDQNQYDKLSAIAPTVVTDSFNLTLAERVAFTGEVIGSTQAAQKAMDEYEAEAESDRQKLKEAGIEGKTITVMEGLYLFGSKYGRGADIVYTYLGFKAPEKLQAAFDGGELAMEVSMETLQEYCGDYILKSVWDGTEDWSQNEVWNNIPAVKENHVIEINFSDYFTRDLYTSKKQIKLLTEELLKLNQK